MATTFNDEQLQAIASKSKEILVSAGAGSGKSTVLVERLMRKMIDESIHVDQFLIVTFTNLAAREMAEKLRRSLSASLADNPTSTHLQAQLYKLPYANISTFHGFCNRVLQRYHYLVDLDVNAQLMDDMEAVLMRAEVLDGFMTDQYADDDFRKLVDVFGSDRSDAALGELIIKIYDLARANPEMETWLARLDGLYHKRAETIDSWAFYSDVKKLVVPLLMAAEQHVLTARELAKKAELADAAHGYVEMAAADLAVISAVREALDTGAYDEVRHLLQHTSYARFPALTKKMKEYWDETLHKEASDARKAFMAILDTLSKDFFAYSNESHGIHFERGAEIVRSLGRMVLLFDERFSAEKLKASKLDFSDLERLTLKVLTEHPDVLAEIASDFKEIMIDEYQDTNDMQERIVKLISDAGGVPMFMVGDVKQSIYRFRLAEPTIFQDKYASYQASSHLGEKIDLMKNYRSNHYVIDAVNYIFAHIMDKAVGEIAYDEAAELKLGIEAEVADFYQPELHIIDKAVMGESGEDMDDLHDAQLEAHHIAREIMTMVAEQAVAYRDIVILLRSMTNVTTIYDTLTQHGIPVSTEQPGDLLAETEVVTILSLLRVIDNPYQDIPLAATLRSPLFFFTEPELATIRTANSASSFYEALKAFATTRTTSPLREKAQDFLAKLQQWRYASRFTAVADTMRQIYEATGYYDFVHGLANGEGRRANLDLLEEIAAGYEARTASGWSGFLHYLDHVARLGKTIPKAKPAATTTESVKIMTIHKSKGLEFPVVFIAGLQKKFNTQDEIGNYVLHKKYGIGVQYINPDLRLKQKTIATTLLAKTLRNEMIAEEMRLLYVALTRAKSKLILTGVQKDAATITKLSGTDVAPMHVRLAANRYLDWVLPVVAQKDAANPWQFRVITEIKAEATGQHRVGVAAKEAPAIDLKATFDRSYALAELTTIVAKQSVSQRKIEETVPLYKGILEPQRALAYDRPTFMTNTVQATEVGTAFHQFMQHLPVKAGHTLDALIELKADLITRGILKTELANRINLEDVYRFTQSDVYRQVLSAHHVQKELPFTMLIQAGVSEQANAMLQGVIDLLAEFDDEVWIVDYKTDRVKDFQLEEAKLRIRYAVQMKYYLQAMRDIYPNKKIVAHVYFVRANNAIVYD
ncbi:MAG: helicase-exonuclease AddAB subunit AddA [Turicibacter sp.]|nr:helicase-exonuclease AddAB subunit AddA [Turicibacter sp.]